jgi:hypothetical protein
VSTKRDPLQRNSDAEARSNASGGHVPESLAKAASGLRSPSSFPKTLGVQSSQLSGDLFIVELPNPNIVDIEKCGTR